MAVTLKSSYLLKHFSQLWSSTCLLSCFHIHSLFYDWSLSYESSLVRKLRLSDRRFISKSEQVLLVNRIHLWSRPPDLDMCELPQPSSQRENQLTVRNCSWRHQPPKYHLAASLFDFIYPFCELATLAGWPSSPTPVSLSACQSLASC